MLALFHGFSPVNSQMLGQGRRVAEALFAHSTTGQHKYINHDHNDDGDDDHGGGDGVGSDDEADDDDRGGGGDDGGAYL